MLFKERNVSDFPSPGLILQFSNGFLYVTSLSGSGPICRLPSTVKLLQLSGILGIVDNPFNEIVIISKSVGNEPCILSMLLLDNETFLSELGNEGKSPSSFVAEQCNSVKTGNLELIPDNDSIFEDDALKYNKFGKFLSDVSHFISLTLDIPVPLTLNHVKDFGNFEIPYAFVFKLKSNVSKFGGNFITSPCSVTG